jgi:hypothetical protein
VNVHLAIRLSRILKIPAPLACYWLGQLELLSTWRKAEED